jgi:hypothetical protein
MSQQDASGHHVLSENLRQQSIAPCGPAVDVLIDRFQRGGLHRQALAAAASRNRAVWSSLKRSVIAIPGGITRYRLINIIRDEIRRDGGPVRAADAVEDVATGRW